MSLVSEYFGDISANPHSKLVATITSGTNGAIVAELVLQDRGRSAESFVKQADVAMKYFGEFDRRARESIASSAEVELTIPGKIFFAQRDILASQRLTPESFARSLTIESVVISPDGGDEQPDRLAVSYHAVTHGVHESFMAIVREGEGLVFAAALNGKSNSNSFGLH